MPPKQNKVSGNGRVVCMGPQGKKISQQLLQEASKCGQLILVAGRYEGIDERFIRNVCDEESALGDYVISGGELATLIVIDAITRLIPGVLAMRSRPDRILILTACLIARISPGLNRAI